MVSSSHRPARDGGTRVTLVTADGSDARGNRGDAGVALAGADGVAAPHCAGRQKTAGMHCCSAFPGGAFVGGVTSVTDGIVATSSVCSQHDTGSSFHGPVAFRGEVVSAPATGWCFEVAIAVAVAVAVAVVLARRQLLPTQPRCTSAAPAMAAAAVTDCGLLGVSLARKHRRQ